MNDLFPIQVTACLVAQGQGFETARLETVPLTLQGISGDRHFGFTRRAGAREPWYPRGTEIRNDRQITLVCPVELGLVAKKMAIEKILPEWIGANFMIEGIEQLTKLAIGTRLMLPSGAALVVNGENHPCRYAGAGIAKYYPDRVNLDLKFAAAARGLRGIIASVERAGQISRGDLVKLKAP